MPYVIVRQVGTDAPMYYAGTALGGFALRWDAALEAAVQWSDRAKADRIAKTLRSNNVRVVATAESIRAAIRKAKAHDPATCTKGLLECRAEQTKGETK